MTASTSQLEKKQEQTEKRSVNKKPINHKTIEVEHKQSKQSQFVADSATDSTLRQQSQTIKTTKQHGHQQKRTNRKRRSFRRNGQPNQQMGK